MSDSNEPSTSPKTGIMLRPETNIAPIVEAAPVERYRARWLNQAWSDFCAKLRQERTLSGMAGALMLGITIILFIGGYAPLISLLPVWVFVAVVMIYFVYVLFRSPRKLDSERQTEIDGLKSEKGTLEAEIDTLRLQSGKLHKPNHKSKLKLKFEAHTRQDEQGRTGQGTVSVKHEQYTFAPPESEPVEKDYYLVAANLRVHFENKGKRDFTLKRMTLSLFRETRSGEESELPTPESNLLVLGEPSPEDEATARIIMPRITCLTGMKIKRGDTGMTSPFWMTFTVEVPPRYGERLNQNCFLRITLESVEQEPYWIDFHVVDCEKAYTDKGTDKGSLITLRQKSHSRRHAPQRTQKTV